MVPCRKDSSNVRNLALHFAVVCLKALDIVILLIHCCRKSLLVIPEPEKSCHCKGLCNAGYFFCFGISMRQVDVLLLLLPGTRLFGIFSVNQLALCIAGLVFISLLSALKFPSSLQLKAEYTNGSSKINTPCISS
jgi:hypothetical protein